MGNTAVKTAEQFIAEGHTPMMAQYHATKAAYPDALLFYRMGDFYEMFFEDAEQAAATLDITLTKRGKNQDNEIPMCGVPYHSCDPYIAKLIRAGFKVAICEQTETPDEAKERTKREGKPASKALVTRTVVRVITQGTLTEDSLLDARANNYLAALAEVGGQYGVAWLDLSTGAFFVQPVHEKDIAATLDRIDAKEILTSEKIQSVIPSIVEGSPFTVQSNSLFDSENARKRLETLFSVGTLESFGGFSRAEIAAAGALIDYVERTQLGKMPYLAPPRQVASGAVMEIDAATRRNLELTRTMTGERKGSLLSVIDRTITAAGARLLQSHLSSPLNDIAAIQNRLDRISLFADDINLRTIIRDQLKSVPDIERALARLSVGRGGPRDLAMLREGLAQSELVRGQLQSHGQARATLADILADLKQNPAIAALQDKLKAALVDEPPMMARDGGFIARGFFSRLDELRVMRDEGRRLIANLQTKYQQQTGIDKLKITYNNMLGYFIEVTSKSADALMVKKEDGSNPFVLRQSMSNAMRFTTPELAELERDISSAADKSIAIELDIFNQLCAETTALSSEIGKIARSLAAIDVAASHADLAIDLNYTRPQIDTSLAFSIEGGRHPVVEAALRAQSEPFVPNNCDLGPAQKLWLLTGPNMAGKSTFLRQNALIAILAQSGAFVPAARAHIGLIDRCFSRVGASDDLARGRSTFMVEMVETAAILNQATNRSLVILDEIGRGTATFDGLSIAWACVEHLHESNKCRGLFATHYHELTALTSRLSSLSAHSMQVKEWKGDIIFMHAVQDGAADRSYGIHVGKLAGLPAAVIGRAGEILALLQSGEQSGALARLVDDLPLFSAAAPQKQQSSPLLEKIATINPDALSPKEALDLIYDIKALAKDA